MCISLIQVIDNVVHISDCCAKCLLTLIAAQASSYMITSFVKSTIATSDFKHVSKECPRSLTLHLSLGYSKWSPGTNSAHGHFTSLDTLFPWALWSNPYSCTTTTLAKHKFNLLPLDIHVLPSKGHHSSDWGEHLLCHSSCRCILFLLSISKGHSQLQEYN